MTGRLKLYQYAPNRLTWIDPWSWCKYSKKAFKKIYIESQSDKIRVNSGLSILPKGEKGTIVDHVKGKDTGYISVSENISGTKKYSSNSGLAKIDVAKATQNGAKYIALQNVQQVVNTKGSLTDRKNVKSANGGLFQGEIPYEAIEIIK